MKRMTVPNRIGNEVSFDFIPGSLEQEPIIITGGLWYKIEYFKSFSSVLTTQSNFKEVLVELESMRTEVERQAKVINELSSKGHPIIVISRETQPESIYESLKKGLIPSYANTAPEVTTLINSGKFKKNDRKFTIKSEDHANDLFDILKYLKTRKDGSGSTYVGDRKIQLFSLSFGSTVLKAFKRKYPDLVQHTTIIAPLSYSGDNYPEQTKMVDTFLKTLKAPIAPLKWNPFTYLWANLSDKFIDESIYATNEYNYSKKLTDNAFETDPELIAKEKEFPGFKELVRQGLALDMASARDFKLGDKKDFDLMEVNTSLYLAGDEEPSRLKSQLADYLLMRSALKEKAPNLIIMDDAQHAITATAPVQTSHIFSNILLDDNIKQTTGKIFYMHRMDNSARIIELEPWAFELIHKEIDALKIGPENASILERIYFPEIFAVRMQYTASQLKDLAVALSQTEKQPIPSNWKENPGRPYEKFLYVDLTPETKEKMLAEIESLKKKIEEFNQIDEEAKSKIKEILEQQQQSKQ